MTRLQAAIGGLLVAPAIVLSIAWGAPELLSPPPSAQAPVQVVAETKIEAPVVLPTESEVDRTAVKTVIFKKVAVAAPMAAVLPEPAAVASVPQTQVVAPSRCERYLYRVAIPKQDGLIDRLFDSRAEEALAEQDRRRRQALNCLRAERGSEGR